MIVTCKMCGFTLRSFDVTSEAKRRKELQRAIANHIQAAHKDMIAALAKNTTIIMDLFVQWMHLELVNVPALETETIQYKEGVLTNLLTILGYEETEEDEVVDDGGDDGEDGSDDGDVEEITGTEVEDVPNTELDNPDENDKSDKGTNETHKDSEEIFA